MNISICNTCVLVLFGFFQILNGQNALTEQQAIKIAIENGLQTGINEPYIEKNDSSWIVRCLYCENESGEKYSGLILDSITGDILGIDYHMTQNFLIGRQAEQSKIQFKDYSDLPTILSSDNKKILFQNSENITRIDFSPNENMILVTYVKGKLYTKMLCDSLEKFQLDNSNFVRWLNNEWIEYCDITTQEFHLKNVFSGDTLLVKNNINDFECYFKTAKDKWIAFTSNEIWKIEQKEKKGEIILRAFINGQGEELCLQSKITGEKKYVTKEGKYIHGLTWSLTGDSLLFYIENDKYYIDNFSDDSISYSKLKGFDNISLDDYSKIKKGKFPHINDCRIFTVNSETLEIENYILKERGRYSDAEFSEGMNYIIFTEKDCKYCDRKMMILKLEQNAL